MLEKLAEQIKGILEKMPDAAQVEFETEGRTPQLQMNVKRDVLQRYSLQASEVNKAVDAALAGQEAGQIIEGNRRYDIVVRMPEELRIDDAQIKKVPLRVGEAGLLPLGDVVEFQTLKTVEPIRRDEGQRRAALMVNLKTRNVEGFVRDAEQRIKQQVKMPEGYLVEFGGQFQHLQEARTRLAVVVPATLALIFVLVFMSFRSVRQTLIIYTGRDRRSARAVDLRNAIQHFRRGGFHRTERRGRARWSGDAQLLQRTARRRKKYSRCCHRRFAHALASRAYDRSRGQLRFCPNGDRDRRRRRSPKAPGHCRHRRPAQLDVFETDSAAGALCLVRT